MHLQTLATYALVSFLAIASPGPAILLTLRNGANFGASSVLWSGVGNLLGVFCLSLAAIFGLGVVLMSSAALFMVVKFAGAGYLFYVGVRHLFGKSRVLAAALDGKESASPGRALLCREAFLTAVTNPKAILFFTALFPQFVDPHASLGQQFFILTLTFMAISYMTHLLYAALASRAMRLLVKPAFARWVDRTVGVAFIAFGSLLLTWRRKLP